MSEPLDYQILAHLKAALLAISVAGGYYYDVAPAAVKIDPATDIDALMAPGGPRPVYGIEFGDDTKEYYPADEVKVARTFKVFAVHDSDPADDNDFMKVHIRLCAEVEKAVRVDPSRGGIALDTLITNTTYNTTFAPKVWTEVDLAVTLYRTNGQP